MPSTPVMSNVTGELYCTVSDVRRLLVAQLYSPVRWTDSIRFARRKVSSSDFIEVGPGRVLTNLLKSINE